MDKVQNCGFETSEFELQLRYWVSFRTNTLLEEYKPTYPPSGGYTQSLINKHTRTHTQTHVYMHACVRGEKLKNKVKNFNMKESQRFGFNKSSSRLRKCYQVSWDHRSVFNEIQYKWENCIYRKSGDATEWSINLPSYFKIYPHVTVLGNDVKQMEPSRDITD